MERDNYLKLDVAAQGENVALVRLVLSGFLSRYGVKREVSEEVKVALSEAVSNAILHGYEEDGAKLVEIELAVKAGVFEMVVEDHGVGIEDVKRAMEPAYSTKREHMGLGFAFMGSFMDQLEVESTVGKGTRVRMRRDLREALVKAV